MPEVLIVTRTKNRKLLLGRALQSVKNQTFKDYTQIVLNNGGNKEEVEETVQSFGSDKVKVIHTDDTISRASALNMAITSADSKYIAILDDDDTWHPEFLQSMLDEIKRRKSHGVVSKIDEVYERLEGGKIKQLSRSRWMADLKVISLYQQCIDNQLSTVGFVYSREAYDAIGGYDEDLNVLEDYEFGLRFLMNFNVDLVSSETALANYHRRVTRSRESADNSFAQEDHRYNFYKIANKYLRQELRDGRLGVGYIMSNIKYQQNFYAQSLRRIMPGFLVDIIKRRLQD